VERTCAQLGEVGKIRRMPMTRQGGSHVSEESASTFPEGGFDLYLLGKSKREKSI